jgi:uncharacterized protein YbaP (TraB family)
MKKIITLIIFSYFFTTQAQENSLLWRISGNGLKKPSYLYGTYHSRDSRAHQFGDSVLVKLAQADLVIVESITDENQDKKGLFKLMMMDGVRLEDLLSKKDYNYVKTQVFKRLGLMGVLFFNDMKPLFTSVMATEKNTRNEMPLTVDDFIKEEGKKQGKKIAALETFEEAMSAIDNIPLKEQAKMLVESFEEYDEQATMGDSLTKMYQRQDLKGMYDYYNSMKNLPMSFEKGLVEDRNKKFVEGLVPYLKENSVFCAVGTLHLPGKTGMISLLRKKGYTVEPIFSDYHPVELIIGRTHEWDYIASDSLNVVMGFPEMPYYENISFSNVDSSKTINFINYYITDTINQIKYSVKAGRMRGTTWNKDEVIESLVHANNYQKISELDENFYGINTNWVEFYVADGVNNRVNIVIEDSILYLVEMEGSKQKLYSDLSIYFFAGIFHGKTEEFQNILDNTSNFNIEITGIALYENKDTVDTYEIYVINEGDTTNFKIEHKNKFDITLTLGNKYIFGFKKEGYQQKHLIVDVVESGTPIDSKYGFEFPMQLTFVKGNVNAPSKHVATVKYDPFTGYMDY